MALTPRSPYGVPSNNEPHFRRAPASGAQQAARPSSRAGSRPARRRDDGDSSSRAYSSRPDAGTARPSQTSRSYESSAERPTVRLAGGASRYQAAPREDSRAGSNADIGHSVAANSMSYSAAYPASNVQEPQRRPFGTPREPMPQLRGHQQHSYGRGRTSRSSVIGQPLGRGAGRGQASLNLSRSGRGSRTFGHRTATAYNGPVRVRRVAACLVTVLFTLATWFSHTTSTGIAPTTETSMLDMPTMALPSIPISTPKSQWKKGTAPHLYQTDPIWSTKSYGGGTIHDNACGPTALTMVYVYVTGNTDMTPLTMATWADAHSYAPSGATEWSFMTEGAAAFGLTSTMVNSTRETITAALKAGKPVISLMNEGDFTSNGHFIVLTDIDEYGNVTINDPYSGYRSSHTWKIGTICRQSTYSWVFETQ